MNLSMCPHCGQLWSARAVHKHGHLIPEHNFPLKGTDKCPGSGQVPRNPESDMRPLWKDGGVK